MEKVERSEVEGLGVQQMAQRGKYASNLKYASPFLAKRNILMGCRRTGNVVLASEQRRLADDSLAVSVINNLLIQAPTAFSAATVICLLLFTK